MLQEVLAAILIPEQKAAGLVLREHEDGVELIHTQIVARFTPHASVADIRHTARAYLDSQSNVTLAANIYNCLCMNISEIIKSACNTNDLTNDVDWARATRDLTELIVGEIGEIT